MKTPRETVYTTIDSERDYQKVRWNDDDETKSVGDFLTFMRTYLTQAETALSHNVTTDQALHEIRKVAALGVACMEVHGAPNRA